MLFYRNGSFLLYMIREGIVFPWSPYGKGAPGRYSLNNSDSSRSYHYDAAVIKMMLKTSITPFPSFKHARIQMTPREDFCIIAPFVSLRVMD